MNVTQITVDRDKARELWREYKKHQNYSTPIDEEIARTYKLLAQGRTVIQAIESVRQAGLGEHNKLPKLAIARADAKECYWRALTNRGEFLSDETWPRTNMTRSRRIGLPWQGVTTSHPDGRAMVPLIPIHLRPKRGLANYHVLFEAEWARIPPRDPYLLRRLGGDLWLVVAAWDLTEVERAAMASRLAS